MKIKSINYAFTQIIKSRNCELWMLRLMKLINNVQISNELPHLVHPKKLFVWIKKMLMSLLHYQINVFNLIMKTFKMEILKKYKK